MDNSTEDGTRGVCGVAASATGDPKAPPKIPSLPPIDGGKAKERLHQSPYLGDPRVGDKIDRFDLRERLGQGATSTVFRAWDEKNGREVALKIPRFGDGSVFMQRFLREARVGQLLHHPNIAEILELIARPERPLMVMELVRGQTLRAKLNAYRAGLPLTMALGISRRICQGLAFAHRRSIIHRDIKPGNVMLSLAGEVKLLDFGIAKVRAKQAHGARGLGGLVSPQITSAGDVLGTAGYMSPEQAKGESIDARTDIFSMGVVLYECFTGTRPFQSGSALETLLAIEERSPLPPSMAKPDLPESLRPAIDHVVLRCLEKDPGRRYADAAELLRELCELSDRALS